MFSIMGIFVDIRNIFIIIDIYFIYFVYIYFFICINKYEFYIVFY